MAHRATSPTPTSPEVLTQEFQSPGGAPDGSVADVDVHGGSSHLTPGRRKPVEDPPVTPPDVDMGEADAEELWKNAWLDERRPPTEWMEQNPVAALSDVSKPLKRIVGAQSATKFIAERLGGRDSKTEAAWKTLREDETWRQSLIDEILEDVPQHRAAEVTAELRSILFDKQGGSGDPLLRLLVEDMHRYTAVGHLRECHAWDAYVGEVDACSPAAIAHRALDIITAICTSEQLVENYEGTMCLGCYNYYLHRTEAEEATKRADLAKLLRDKATADTRSMWAISAVEMGAMVASAAAAGGDDEAAQAGNCEGGDTAVAAVATEPMAVTWCSLHPCMHWMCYACAMTNIKVYNNHKCPNGCHGEILFVRPIVRDEAAEPGDGSEE